MAALQAKRDDVETSFGIVTNTYRAAVAENREALSTAAKRSYVKSEKGSSGSGDNKRQKVPEKKIGFGAPEIERLVQHDNSSSSSSSSSSAAQSSSLPHVAGSGMSVV